ncbi:MAG: hypothetical protein P8X98_13905, partial [Woeseiaceae bacterium]
QYYMRTEELTGDKAFWWAIDDFFKTVSNPNEIIFKNPKEIMRTTLLTIAATLITSTMMAQFRQGPQLEPPPEGFRPASTNIFLADYPAVNQVTREAIFKVVAPTARQVQIDIAGKKYDMTKDTAGVWTGMCDPQVVGFHYYAIVVDGVRVTDKNTRTFFGSNWEMSGIEIPEGPEGDYYRFNSVIPLGQVRSIFYWSELNGHTSTINVSTAPVIAREVYNAVTGFGSVTTTAGAQFTTAGPFDQVDQLDVTGDFGPLDIACAISGNALVSGSKVVADGYSAGDTLAANFAACARGGEVLNGDLDFTLASFGRGAGSTFFVSGSVTETELIRTMGGSCFTGSGSFETSYDSMFTSAGIIYVEGFADTFDVAAGGRSQHLTGAGNSAEIQVAQQPVTVVRSSWGTISSDDIAGSYNYESLTPAYFSLRMVALDELTLRLDIDLDGDSTIDEMLLTSWATLAYDDWVCP